MIDGPVERLPLRGRFITFEGGEGSGKSTQIKILADRLNQAHISSLTTREPGGSAGAEIMRHLVLSGVGKLLGPDAETLLFAAARDDHVRQVIEPALGAGTWVLCDRFTDSTRVYQGSLGRTDPAIIRAMERVTIGDLQPDLTLILDIPVAFGLKRAIARRGKAVADRFEQESIESHETLRQAYRQLAQDEPRRCVLIDANSNHDAVAQRIWTVVEERLLRAPHAIESKSA
jgi:dTMP kinase